MAQNFGPARSYEDRFRALEQAGGGVGATGATGPAGATGPTGPSGGSGSSVSVDISSAQLLALGDSSPVLIPAPGVGKANILLSTLNQFTAGSHIYDSDNGGNVGVGYGGSPVSGVVGTTNYGLDTNQAGFWHFGLNSPISNTQTTPFADIENKAIVLKGQNLTAGPIVSSTKGSGGTGYAVGDTGILPNDSGDASYVVDSISGGGGTGPVVTYHLSDVGTGYAIQSGAATEVSTGGGDGNFTINITSVLQGNGTAKVTLSYVEVTLP